MPHLAVLLLVAGVGLVALHEGMVPLVPADPFVGKAVQAGGGALTILGIAVVGFALPLFR